MEEKNYKIKPLQIHGLASDEMPIGAYCSPQPAAEIGGKKYPSMINLKAYRLLADLGVNLVYGQNEILGLRRACKEGIKAGDAAVFKALEFCEKVGISYLVKIDLCEEYISLGFKDLPDWRKLSEKEKQNLDARFAANLRRVKEYKAFAGISFRDEPGADSFEGIAAAKKVFDRECPGKLFYVNMYYPYITPQQMQYGLTKGTPDCTVAEFGFDRSNEERWEHFLRLYMETVRPEFLSYDGYPFMSLGGVESMHHCMLYVLQQISNRLSKKYGVPYWLFMQAGGRWEGNKLVRVPDFAEILLQVNISLAYGARGIQLFPACLPNEWLPDVPAGVIGRADSQSGGATEHYYYFKYAFKQLKACQKYLMNADFVCAVLGGEFQGLLPPEPELQKIQWNDTIFRGKLPKYNDPAAASFRELKAIEATSQFFVGCFDYNGSSLFYAVNNSIVTAANVRLKFDKPLKFGLIYKGEETEVFGDEVYMQRVAAGDGFLLYME